jgi:hypothetical protein
MSCAGHTHDFDSYAIGLVICSPNGTIVCGGTGFNDLMTDITTSILRTD